MLDEASPRSAVPFPGSSLGPGAARKQARSRARGSPRLTTVCFSFLAETSLQQPWPAARGAKPGAMRRARAKPPAGRRPRPGVCSPQLGQTSWACSVCKPVINAICRNENIPLKCVFEQVLEKTRRWREHLWLERCF